MRTTAFDAWLLDLDGVVYVGDQVLPGVHEALAALRRAGKQLRFLTNDPRPTREQLVARLQRLGIEARVEEVVTCGWATARFLAARGIRSAFVVGSAGLAEELERAGIAVARDGLPEAVVVGADERMSFLDVVQGAVLVQRGALFVATNADASYPMPIGTVPATGAVVCAIHLAAQRRPLIVGKPEPLMFQLALETLPPGSRALVVGDRVESDILGAHRAGLPAILVAPRAPEFPSPRDLRRPDAVVSSLAEAVERAPDLPDDPPVAERWPERILPGVVLLVTDTAGERVALIEAHGETVLPWTELEPLETFEEAAQRLFARLSGDRVDRSLEPLGPVSGDGWLVSDRDGAAVQLAGQAYLGRIEPSALEPEVRWVELAALEAHLPPMQAGWCRQRLARSS
ncbi:HAD-IIA family hydrolase [Thermomicrobium sp. 4228-Ro]|uniref:HAD-IIA family hydrolase n=1 Tax=Thermomicrobium sp. 4228-Ro TaxID=2993937 RepID=UPI002249122F|nr:HAD-IIA family hydrolase [Thermomicrobium sp. 4228-Ro]MCX2727440.1 HAD-IIA family hydrolase [Thermomicrobium sp. 4228-Ro]